MCDPADEPSLRNWERFHAALQMNVPLYVEPRELA
jgi:hypothetical protein